jgi:hypothetical protein
VEVICYGYSEELPVTGICDTCNSIGDLLGVYALDALEPDEAERVRMHIQTCPRCAHEVADHQETIGLVAARGLQAPPAVWDAIATTIDGLVPSPGPLRSPALFRRSRPRASPLRRPSRIAAAALAAAAAAAIGTQAIKVDSLNHRVNQLSVAAEQAGGFQGVAAALVDPSARHLVLTSTRPGAQKVGELVILPSGTAYLVASGMPGLSNARTYQLWMVVDRRAISVGVMGAHPGTVPFSIDPGVATSAFLLTVEPAGGVVTPTTAPIAQASV